MSGQMDTTLSEIGEQQAALIALRLQYDKFTHLYSSDLKRAHQVLNASSDAVAAHSVDAQLCKLATFLVPTKTIIKKQKTRVKTNLTQRARAYEVTSFLGTDCELSTETCSKNVYSPMPWSLPWVG